jgi:hypothetical protein
MYNDTRMNHVVRNAALGTLPFSTLSTLFYAIRSFPSCCVERCKGVGCRVHLTDRDVN